MAGAELVDVARAPQAARHDTEIVDTNVDVLYHLKMSRRLPLPVIPGAPLYTRAAAGIRAHVEDRSLEPGAALPAEHELAEMLGVSRITLRRAVDELVKANVLIRRQGVGTFVARGRIVQSLTDLQSTRDLLMTSEGAYSSVILTHAIGRATAAEAELLGLRQNASVMRFVRVDSNSGEAFGLARYSIPKVYGQHFTAEMLNHNSSYKLFVDLCEVHPDSATQKLRAERASAEAAEILEIQTGDPVFEVERVTYDTDGAPIEWALITYKYDAVEFRVELSKQPQATSANGTVSAALRGVD